MPRNGIAGSYGYFEFFKEPPHCFPTLAAPVYTPTNSAQGFPLLHILANAYFLSCWYQPFWPACGDISSWFWFAFPWWSAMLSTFSRVCWPSACLLWKNVQVFCPLFNRSLFFRYWVVWVLHTFWMLAVTSYVICEFLLPYRGCLFVFLFPAPCRGFLV